VQVTTAAGRTYDGLQTKQQFCGVGIGSEGLPFLVLLNQMDPDAPRGDDRAVDRLRKHLHRRD
jgi:hypothetical protein